MAGCLSPSTPEATPIPLRATHRTLQWLTVDTRIHVPS